MGLFCSSYCSKSARYMDDHTSITTAAEGMPFNQNSQTDVSYCADAVLHQYIVL